jgi:hypothetical protein
LNVRGVNDVRQTEIHTAEPVVPKSSAFEFELAIEKLKSHKLHQFPEEVIKARCRKIHYEIHKLTTSILNKGELPEEWKDSIILPFYKKGDKTDCSNYRSTLLLANYVQNVIQNPIVKINSICRGNYWESSIWFSTQQVNYRSYILRSSIT